MPSTSSVPSTANSYINGLLSGVRWNATSFTYSFPSSVSYYGTDFDWKGTISNFEVLSALQQAAVQTIFASISSFTNLSFSLITESATTHGDLRFGMSDLASTAFAVLPISSADGGDSFYRNTGGAYDNTVRGNYAFETFMHEIGHALGLKHPHEVQGLFGAMPVDRDSMEYSVMTYRSYVGASPSAGLSNETWGFAQTYMMYDIAALQYMYGANYSYNATATVYQWNPTTGAMSINGVGQAAPGGNRIFMTVWDGGGIDTYDLSNYSNAVTIDLRPGEWTTTSAVQLANLGNGNYARGNVANSLLFNGDQRSIIENAKGGVGNDTLVGNVVANVLDGGGGTDTVWLAGFRSDYSFSGTLLNFTANGLGAVDTLINVEFVKFLGSNETVAVSGLLSAVTPTDDFRDSITDNTAALGSILVGTTIQGNIETNGDTDVFSISLTAGQTYTFAVSGSGSGGGTLVDPMLEVRNSAGTILASNDDWNGTNDPRITFTPSASGTYYLVADGYGTGVGTYTLSATGSTPADDYRDSISDPTAPLGTLTVGGTRTGNIETDGDTDVFSVTLTAGQTYTFTARGTAGGGGTLANPMLELRNSSGTILASNDNSGGTNDSLITFTATAGGTYYLVADSFGSGTGTYTLGASTVSVADDFRDTIGDTTAPLGTLTVGGTRTGNIETDGDTDVFSITLTAGQTYTFNARGTASGGGTLANPMLELRNSSGTILASNDNANGTNDSQIIFTASAGGTYYLVADGVGTGTGTYTLGATSNTVIVADDFRDSLSDRTAPLGSLSIGSSRIGNIETNGDTDLFKVSLTAGQTYTFTVRGTASGGGTLVDPMLELRNSSGRIITTNDDYGGTYDSRITFTPTATGTYYLMADGYGTGTGTYTITAVRGTAASPAAAVSDPQAPGMAAAASAFAAIGVDVFGARDRDPLGVAPHVPWTESHAAALVDYFF